MSEGSGGRVYGLWNLAAVCRNDPERRWPEIVRDHCARVDAVMALSPEMVLTELTEIEGRPLQITPGPHREEIFRRM